jgi:hypothetical protein
MSTMLYSDSVFIGCIELHTRRCSFNHSSATCLDYQKSSQCVRCMNRARISSRFRVPTNTQLPTAFRYRQHRQVFQYVVPTQVNITPLALPLPLHKQQFTNTIAYANTCLLAKKSTMVFHTMFVLPDSPLMHAFEKLTSANMQSYSAPSAPDPTVRNSEVRFHKQHLEFDFDSDFVPPSPSPSPAPPVSAQRLLVEIAYHQPRDSAFAGRPFGLHQQFNQPYRIRLPNF